MIPIKEKKPIKSVLTLLKRKTIIKIVILMIQLVKVPLGGYCTQDEQCQRSEHLGVCRQGRCVCRTGYILLNLECHAGKPQTLFKKYTCT